MSKFWLRAVRRHGDAFRAGPKRYIDGNQSALKVESSPITTYHSIFAEMSPVPEDMAVIVGDITHQLRSAPDHLACDLAE